MGDKVILAGGSGFIGQALAKRFVAQGDEVIVLSLGMAGKKETVTILHWDGKTLGDWAKSVEGAALLINLAGKSVDCRYNAKNKKAIRDSRVDPTRALGQAIGQLKNPPKLWINSSTATIYRHAEDRPMDEATGEIGSGFSVDVATAWENAFFESQVPRTRKVALRSAIVLGKEGGVFIPFKNLVKLGLGGVQGNGRQMFSWVHEEDLFEVIRFIQKGKMDGIMNVSSPNPLPNREVMKTFRKALRMLLGLPQPEWLLRIGAWLIRTETELLLKSRWVVPGRLLQEGYQFRYPTFPEALANLVG
jgi:uncharacterized protein (TIGR01777 family)